MLRYLIIRTLSLLTLLSTAALSQTPVGRGIPGRFIVTYRNGAIPGSAEAVAHVSGARLVQRHDRLGIAIIQALAKDAAKVRASLNADPAIASVVEDRVVDAYTIRINVASATPNSSAADALYSGPQGWAVRQVGGYGTPSAPGPWNITTGSGVRIAILDSGVDATHPDIAPNLSLNITEIDQSPVTGLPSVCDDGSPQDQQGHGTWSASLAAAAAGPNTGLVAGVAPGATILNIKVLERLPSATTSFEDPTGCGSGQASGLLSWVLAGIEDAVQQHADIISMSFGTLVDMTTGEGAGIKAVFDQVTHAAANAGVILIASAGNDGFDLSNQRYLELPAQARDVVAIVASTNPACAENLAVEATCAPGPITVPYYSNFGVPLNALAAPGGSYPPNPEITAESGWIWGACSQGIPGTLSGSPTLPGQSFGCFELGHVGYVQAMGTSASAPLAAGAAALILAANPKWSAADVIQALRSSATVMTTLPVPHVNAAAVVTATGLHLQHITKTPQR